MSDKYRIDPNVRTHGMGTGAKLTEWDQLRAENERLRQELADAAAYIQKQDQEADAEIERLRDQNERLRRRLKGARKFFEDSQRTDWRDDERTLAIQACARQLDDAAWPT